MSASSVLDTGRRRAEALMLDAGKAIRSTGGYVYNETTQADEREFTPIFGSDAEPVPCKMQSTSLAARPQEVGGRTATMIRVELHLPASTAPLSAGDVWEIVTTHPLSLSEVGQQWRVIGPAEGTIKTARRYEVEVFE